MQELPIAIGSFHEQKRFIERNAPFLLEFPNLNALTKKVFIRRLKLPVRAEAADEQRLPEEVPGLAASTERLTARIVFYLGRMAADDFGEILTLAGNGRGFGAYKIVRGMYERVVTALYLEKNPAEARAFAESSAITRLNFLNRILEDSPGTESELGPGILQSIQKDAAAAQAKRKQSICSKCHQPITQEAWTRVSLDAMAKAVDPSLAVLYPPFYLEGTMQAHANMFGIERRLFCKDGAISYKETSEDEARFAVHLGHHLMIRVLVMQNKYFNLGHDEDVQRRADAFVAVWDGAGPPDVPL